MRVFPTSISSPSPSAFLTWPKKTNHLPLFVLPEIFAENSAENRAENNADKSDQNARVFSGLDDGTNIFEHRRKFFASVKLRRFVATTDKFAADENARNL